MIERSNFFQWLRPCVDRDAGGVGVHYEAVIYIWFLLVQRKCFAWSDARVFFNGASRYATRINDLILVGDQGDLGAGNGRLITDLKVTVEIFC